MGWGLRCEQQVDERRAPASRDQGPRNWAKNAHFAVLEGSKCHNFMLLDMRTNKDLFNLLHEPKDRYCAHFRGKTGAVARDFVIIVHVELSFRYYFKISCSPIAIGIPSRITKPALPT